MPALLADTAAYSAQVLRTKKVQDIPSRINNPAGRPGEDVYALERQRALEAQAQSSSSAYGPPTRDALLRQATVENVIPNVVTASQLGGESTMILSARGTFYLVKLAATYGPGIYSIDELTREVTASGDNAFRRPGESTSPILLTSVEFNQVDITSQVPCLNNVKVFYSFGQNFGQVVISGEVLLGPLGDMSYAGVDRLVSFFWRNRVSVKRKPVAVSVANNSYFVYLTGLRIGQVNPDFHIMPFVMFGTLLDITREQASAINVRGEVMTGGSLEEPSLFKALQQIPPADPEPIKGPGEVTPPVSPDNNPSLNQGSEVSPSKAGEAGNSTASKIQAQLMNQPQTQEEKDQAAMKAERAKVEADLASLRQMAATGPNAQMSVTFQESKLATLDSAIAIQDARIAQSRNLQSNAKMQEVPTVTPEQAKYASDVAREVQANQSAVSTPAKTTTP